MLEALLVGTSISSPIELPAWNVFKKRFQVCEMEPTQSLGPECIGAFMKTGEWSEYHGESREKGQEPRFL